MNASTRLRALSLLRLIVELKGSNMATNDVYLQIVGEREAEELAEELEELEDEGLIVWSETAEQWSPTMRGLLIGMGMSPYEPSQVLLDPDSRAECA